MKITKILVAGLASTCMTISAMAEVANPVNTSIPTTNAIVFNNHLDSADLSYAFGGSENLQIQAMTSQEMDETQGAWVANAVGGIAGGLGGHFGYMSSAVITGQYNAGSHMASIGVGALSGAISPVKGVGSVAWGLGAGTGFGAFQGWASTKYPTINIK